MASQDIEHLPDSLGYLVIDQKGGVIKVSQLFQHQRNQVYILLILFSVVVMPNMLIHTSLYICE